MSMNQPSRRKRRKMGSKAERAAKNARYQAQLRERKRQRSANRARHGVHPGPVEMYASMADAEAEMHDAGGQLAESKAVEPVDNPYLYNKHFGRDELEANQMGLLRDIAKYKGVKVGRLRKVDLIDAILAKQAEGA